MNFISICELCKTKISLIETKTELYINEYFENYDKFQIKLVFCFSHLMGGIGDYIKFFSYLLYYCIKNDIRMYCLTGNLLDSHIKLKYNQMYITSDKIINPVMRPSSLDDMNDCNVHYIVFPTSMYSYSVYDNIYSINDIFYFTDKVKENANTYCNLSNYISIHIRLGDKYLDCDPKDNIIDPHHEKEFDENKLFKLIENNKYKKIIFFCENTKYKLKLKEKYDFITILNIKIGHTALGVINEEEFLNTITEYYIMTRSEMIYSNAESGFSITASKFYDIPYTII